MDIYEFLHTNDIPYERYDHEDKDLWQSKAIQCHALVNTSTLVISRDDIERFLILTGHTPMIFNVPGRVE